MLLNPEPREPFGLHLLHDSRRAVLLFLCLSFRNTLFASIATPLPGGKNSTTLSAAVLHAASFLLAQRRRRYNSDRRPFLFLLSAVSNWTM